MDTKYKIIDHFSELSLLKIIVSKKKTLCKHYDMFCEFNDWKNKYEHNRQLAFRGLRQNMTLL